MLGDGRQGALVSFLGEGDVVNAGHIRAAGLCERMGDEWHKYFKFAIARNPWDRLVSSYHYFVQDEEKRYTELGEKIAQCGGFRGFCVALHELDLDPHFDPQVSYMIDYNGKMLLDWVGRFEFLERDLRAFCAKFGIPLQTVPHYRRSSRSDYRSYYDEETQAIVAERYRSDIAAFNYRF